MAVGIAYLLRDSAGCPDEFRKYKHKQKDMMMGGAALAIGAMPGVLGDFTNHFGRHEIIF